MSPEFFASFLPQVARKTDLVCLHLMGEPLVHPQLARFVDICEENQVQIFLVTNGSLLREKEAELLLRPTFRQVNFSLHSFQSNFGGEKDITKYLERVFAFADRAMDVRPDLYINFRLWNLGDPRGVEPKNQLILSRVEKHFGVTLNHYADVTLRKHKRIKNRLYAHFDTEFTWPSMDVDYLGDRGTCHGLSTHFGILVDGTVVPCCLDKEGVIPLGNLNESPLDEILNSERAQNMLNGFKAGRLVEPLCQRCPYIRRFERRIQAPVSPKASEHSIVVR